MWTGGYTHKSSVDAPWLLKFAAVLAILSIVGALLFGVAVAIGAMDIGMSANTAIYIAVLHFLMPIGVVYTVTTNSLLSRFIILVYVVTLYVATMRGMGVLGTLDIDPTLRGAVATGILFVVVLWLFGSPKMRLYYALISNSEIPSELESQAAAYMDGSKLNPRVRRALDWIADHVETIVLLGFIILAVYAAVSTG